MTDWPVLASLSAAERHVVLQAGRERRFIKGETIVRCGNVADSLHLVSAGRVSVRVSTESGEQLILRVLGPGSILGEHTALAERSSWPVTAVAMGPCTTIALRRGQVRELVEHHPRVSAHLLASLAGQLIRISERMLEIVYVPTARRVQRRLLALHDDFGDQTISVTQRELALMAGVTRSTVNAVVRDLERRGIVCSGRARLRVIDPIALRGSRRRRIRGQRRRLSFVVSPTRPNASQPGDRHRPLLQPCSCHPGRRLSGVRRVGSHRRHGRSPRRIRVRHRGQFAHRRAPEGDRERQGSDR